MSLLQTLSDQNSIVTDNLRDSVSSLLPVTLINKSVSQVYVAFTRSQESSQQDLE